MGIYNVNCSSCKKMFPWFSGNPVQLCEECTKAYLTDQNKKDFEAFKESWKDYPSQDNEGFIPDRGGFKCGWFSALEWERIRKK